jgi:hypothetical protein
MTDARIRVETEQFYQPHRYNDMTERERTIARACFHAGREGAEFPWTGAQNIQEERVALAGYEWGKAYTASLKV